MRVLTNYQQPLDTVLQRTTLTVTQDRLEAGMLPNSCLDCISQTIFASLTDTHAHLMRKVELL